MTSYVTPKINTAYVFYVSLEDKANPGLFKASPTLASGDVKVSTDDGAPGNIATLPAVDADFTKRLKVTLSAGEMNGDNVTVIFSDAAGAEWCDLEINIQTTARQVDDLAFPVVSGRGLDVSTTGEAEANVTQLDGQTEPLDNLVLSLLPDGLFAKLNSMLEAAGLAYRFTAEALAEAQSASTAALNAYDPPTKAEMDDAFRVSFVFDPDTAGATFEDLVEGMPVGGLTAQETADAVHNLAPVGTPAVGSMGAELDAILNGLTGVGLLPLVYTVTVTGTATPIEGVTVEVYTEEACINCIRRGTTNSFGVVTFWFTTPGTYWLHREKDNVTFDNPDTEVVAA